MKVKSKSYWFKDDNLTHDKLISFLLGHKNFKLIVSQYLERVATVLMNDYINKIIRDEYDGDIDEYLKKRGKRGDDLTVEVKKSKDPYWKLIIL